MVRAAGDMGMRFNPDYSRITVNNDDKWLKTRLFSVTYVRVFSADIRRIVRITLTIAKFCGPKFGYG